MRNFYTMFNNKSTIPSAIRLEHPNPPRYNKNLITPYPIKLSRSRSDYITKLQANSSFKMKKYEILEECRRRSNHLPRSGFEPGNLST